MIITKSTIDTTNYISKRKKKRSWLSLTTKSPVPTEKSKKQRDNTKTPPKTSIEQQLRMLDVGETTATKLVWFNMFTYRISYY